MEKRKNDNRHRRPRLSEEKRTNTHSFTLRKKHYAKIQNYASKYDIGLSEALRSMIDELTM